MITFFLATFFYQLSPWTHPIYEGKVYAHMTMTFCVVPGTKASKQASPSFSDKRMKISTHFGKKHRSMKIPIYQIGHILCIYWLPKELPPIPQWPKSLDGWDGIIQWNL
jgi:hypothetical protein